MLVFSSKRNQFFIFILPPWDESASYHHSCGRLGLMTESWMVLVSWVIWYYDDSVWQCLGRLEHGIVSKMVLASAAGTGPIFPGAPAPPDVNVANPTRPGIRLPCSVTKMKKKQIPPWCPGTRPGIRLDQPSTATPKFEGKCRLILARYMAWTN